VKRRNFLKLSAAGAAAAAVGIPLLGRRGYALSFGEFPSEAASKRLPKDVQAQSVLEIFLQGGLSAWETLYLVEEYGRPTDPMFPNTQFYTFPTTGSRSIQDALSECAFPGGEPMGVSFATDSNGADVKLGPFAYLLRQRADMTDRMRVIVQRHTLEPHEAAVPLSLTGKPVGQPAAAGLGAHLQRYFIQNGPADRKAPYSYVFSTGGILGDNVSVATATGFHSGVARPLHIKVDNAETLTTLLRRPEIGNPDDRDRYDALLASYVEQHRNRLRWQGTGAPTRSARFTELDQSAAAVRNAQAVSDIMDDTLFTPRGDTTCNDENGFDVPGISLNAARYLLTHPSQPARYVMVADTGLIEASGRGGYDTHTDNSHDQARNFHHLLKNLTAVVNQPGEDDPTKIDLDKTMIILNTEFGRTPFAQSGSGRNHHPYGYVTAVIGGPVTSAQKGVFGAIGPDGVADEYVSPGTNRAAAMLALGIWPFAQESLAVGDINDAGTELDGVQLATERVLGYSL
jgi:hypothetical protein